MFDFYSILNVAIEAFVMRLLKYLLFYLLYSKAGIRNTSIRWHYSQLLYYKISNICIILQHTRTCMQTYVQCIYQYFLQISNTSGDAKCCNIPFGKIK